MEIKRILNYEELVMEAKSLLTRSSLIKMKIAKIALDACTIRHGGRSGNHYTLTNFAKDVGISRKQLSLWTLTYTNVVRHIEDLCLEETDWVHACRVHALITAENTRLRALNNSVKMKEIFYAPNRDEVIKLMARVQQDGAMSSLKAVEYLQRSQFHLNTCVEKDVCLKKNHNTIMTNILQMQKTCNEILQLITKEE